MTNFIYDFTIGWPVTPHIGFGVGAVDNVDSISLRTTLPLAAGQQLAVSVRPGGMPMAESGRGPHSIRRPSAARS